MMCIEKEEEEKEMGEKTDNVFYATEKGLL
jgi:hypothetical protein